MAEETLVVAPMCSRDVMRTLEGNYMDMQPGEEWHVLREGDMAVVAQDTGNVLCRIRRDAIPSSLCDLAVRCYMDVGTHISTNRGTAAGMQHRVRGSNISFERGMPANSGIMGYMDSLRHNLPCRLTAFSRDHFDAYADGLPFIRHIDTCFQETAPEEYARQRNEAQKTSFHIDGTAFSTVTVNLDYRTSLHRDSGDFAKGFGNLVVCSAGIQGGLLLFPRYRVAIELHTGDFLAMNVHEWHCNTPVTKQRPDGYRLSFVCYLRGRMHRCDEKNRLLEHMAADRKTDVTSICKRIFETAREELPSKQIIGSGPSGIVWWKYDGIRYCIIYLNKRYVLHDKLTHTTIHNLWPALEYAVQHDG